MKKKFDRHSISTRLWACFILFAVLLLAMIWILQIFFVNNYYERMKMKETSRLANRITEKYQNSGYSLDKLNDIITEVSTDYDLSVYIRNGDDLPVTDESGNVVGRSVALWDARTQQELILLHQQLLTSHFNSTNRLVIQRNDMKTLEYACFLKNRGAGRPGSENNSGNAGGSSGNRLSANDVYIMYIISPLYPVNSTIAILRHQLIYITIIAILLAVLMGAMLSHRVSQPIREITEAAAEMGKGNYNVKFRGGHYSEVDELAETLTMASSEMEKTGQYQQDLIANVSHDLKTPLTMIKSYAEMIRDLSGDNPEKRNKHLSVIIDESDRLNTLVNDMLTLSRMQSKRMVLINVPFDMNRVVSSVLAHYEILEEQEGYHIDVSLSKTPLFVNGDEAKIKQVINNLMTNAVKYCGEDKVIKITVKRQNRKAYVSVEDHGMGIAPEELPHVWDKYYKSSTHHVRPTEGTGLGLSIVKEILNMHRADFDVKSTVGKGSTFWFALPLMKNPPKPMISGSTPSSRGKKKFVRSSAKKEDTDARRS